MSYGDTTLTVVGNLTADPELRFIPTGAGVVAFTIAASRRIYDRDTGQWKDGDTLFMRCSAWRDLAEHIAETLVKGMRVIASGRLKQREYQDREGITRTIVEMDVEEIGPSLRYATARVTKATRESAPHPATAATDGAAGGDRWASMGGGWGGTGGSGAADSGDEPPF